MTDDWTVVRGNVKKVKEDVDPKTKLTRQQMKEFMEKMPKIDTLPPLRQSETIFDAFLASVEKNKQPQSGKAPELAPVKNGTAQQNGNLTKKSSKTKKKSDDKKKLVDKPPKSLEEALEKIDASDLKQLMDTTQMRFPESPSLWLKDLECYLNVKMNFSLADPTYPGKPAEYPLSAVPEDIIEIIENLFSRCNEQVLRVFFDRLVTEMLENQSKGIRTNANRILVQAIVREHPQFVSQALPKFIGLRKTYQDRHPICMSLFWVVGQAGVIDFEVGLKVWLEFMMPILGEKLYSKYIVDYLESLMDWHQATSFAEYIGIYEFFPILDTCFIKSAVLPANLQRDLMKLYPKIKSHSFGAEPRTFFPSFLTRLTPTTPDKLKAELLSCLVHCLVTDAQCFGAWRQMYPKYLLSSSILLEHLLKRWNAVGATLSRKPFKETLEKFSALNEQMAAKDHKVGREALTDCRSSCTNLLSKMHTPSSIPWKLLIFVVLSALSCVFIYDCQLHGSITSSKTVTFLRDAGVISVAHEAWVKTIQYSNSSYVWAEKNVPAYYAQFCKSCAPLLATVASSFSFLKKFVVDKVYLAHDVVVQTIPKVLKWIDDTFPGYLAIISAYLTQAGSIILDAAQQMWVFAARYLQLIGAWLSTNVFTGELAVDKLQAHAFSAVNTVQSYAMRGFQWISQQLNSH